MLNIEIEEYFKNPRTIKHIDTDDTYNLILTFDNEEVRIYSMRDKIEGVFSILQNIHKFSSVFIDEFGNAAWDIDPSVDSSEHWNNRIDICKDALYLESQPIIK